MGGGGNCSVWLNLILRNIRVVMVSGLASKIHVVESKKTGWPHVCTYTITCIILLIILQLEWISQSESSITSAYKSVFHT